MLVFGPHVVKWVIDHCDCFAPNAGSTAIGWADSAGNITAGVMYEEFTEASIHATIAVKHGSTMAKKFLWAIFDYPFNQLGVKKIIVQMSSGNIKSASLAVQLGFGLEAQVKDAYLDGDRLIYTMPVENCKWLEILKNEQESENPEGT